MIPAAAEVKVLTSVGLLSSFFFSFFKKRDTRDVIGLIFFFRYFYR